MLFYLQPAVYIFCLDTSRQAIETGYLKVFCEVLLDELDKLPGDSRTQVTLVTSAARFGNLEPFGSQYFDLAILKFGYFLSYLSKIVKKPCLKLVTSIIFRVLM